MRLDGVLTTAASGLDSVSKQLGIVGQNVANANTAGYVRESIALTALTAGNEGMGVRSGVATRTLDSTLQGEVFGAAGQSAGDQLRSTALTAVDAAAGAPGSGQDLASLVGNLRDGFSALANDPANQTQQHAVVTRAASLAQGLNTLGDAIGTARQTAQDGLLDDVAQANAGLRQLGVLSDAVMQARARGDSTADLEDKRDTAMQSVAVLTGARFLRQANGDLLAVSGGTVLPLRSANGPLSIGAATLAPGSTAPPLLVSGAPAALGFAGSGGGAGGGSGGGRIGAALDLRDTVLPGLQAKADSLGQNLAAGFSSAGLALFTDASGAPPAVPPAAATGFAQGIQVNPAVTATPSMVRDGAAAASTAGDTTLISTVLNTVLASGSGTLAGQAAALVADNAGLAATAAKRLDTSQGVQSSLSTKLSAGTAVSVDSEMTDMVRLQNSYGANAKVLSAVQAMYTQLLEIVR
ncbi:MAG: flagellar hook-associated protein FlgK [Janthinobacterium lividum]